MPDTGPTKPARHHSVCPHDCPSTCALLVERLDARTIGRVYGDPDNAYTAGVICAKVARYAERVHYPDRLKTPLRRIGLWDAGKLKLDKLHTDNRNYNCLSYP